MVETQHDEVAAATHESILAMLRDRYDRPIMNNVDRGDYVECMIVTALGADWGSSVASLAINTPAKRSFGDLPLANRWKSDNA